MTLELQFKPCTLGVLIEACRICALDLDAVLVDLSELEGLDLPLSKAQAFCDAVLSERLDLSLLPIAEAEAASAYVVADFFTEAWRARWQPRAQALSRFMSAPAFPTQVAAGLHRPSAEA